SVVVAELRAAGYLESTIGQYARTIKVLARFAAARGSDYSPELGAEFAAGPARPARTHPAGHPGTSRTPRHLVPLSPTC
ncbi:MAG TPA: hypothetical protein VGI74_03560, partial [Streptosporangiaceae bacterium]